MARCCGGCWGPPHQVGQVMEPFGADLSLGEVREQISRLCTIPAKEAAAWPSGACWRVVLGHG